MWAIKILNGSQSGKIFPLQVGNNVLGRSIKADIRLADQGVSKSHAQIFVTDDKVIISDLKSSNGTFVNGIQVQNHGLKTGDKVLINQTIFTIFQLPDNVVFADKKLNAASSSTALAQVQNNTHTNAIAHSAGHALESQAQDMQMALESTGNTALAPAPQQQQLMQLIVTRAENYLDEVALPPIYKTAEKVDFKYMLLMFSLLFIFLSTFLSVFPLSRITKESVLNESKRRALTLSRNLAQMNRKALAEDSELSMSTDFIARESGVEKVMIVSAKTGGILAPANLVGRYLSDPFIISLRNTTVEKVELINDKQVAASVPMKFFNADVGESVVQAYSVVVYNIDPLAIDFNRTLSLFVQIFLIACVIGAGIYLIQYRLILYPIKNLNKAIDKALSEGASNIQIPFQLSAFQDLVSNINSALSRISSDFAGTDQVAANTDKSVEAFELVKMFPIPAFALDPVSKRFIAINPALETHSLFDSGRVLNMSIDELTDKSLYESLKDLVQTCTNSPNNTHSNVLPTNGSESFEISAKAIINGNKTSYLLFTVMQIAEEEAES